MTATYEQIKVVLYVLVTTRIMFLNPLYQTSLIICSLGTLAMMCKVELTMTMMLSILYNSLVCLFRQETSIFPLQLETDLHIYIVFY